MDKQENIKNIVKILPKYKGLIFDLDGTLVDLGVDWITLKKELSDFFYSKTGKRIIFSPLNQTLFKINKKFGGELFNDLIKIISDFETKAENYVPNWELINFINNQDVQFAIYSMNTNFCISEIIEHFLNKKPKTIISKENCLELKPTNIDLERILDLLKTDKKDVIFVGNSDEDKISAKMAEIDFLRVKI